MSYFILADCNNFYVSCERLFNPKIEKRPVIALSQNDGCVIARSQEAKLLGIKMGEPYFKVKNLCQHSNVVVFSSNYQLYADISERVMNVLSQATPDFEIYSIDEAFLKFQDHISENEILQESFALKKLVMQWVGIPISIGIGPTKTLAKVANSLAKKNREVGVFSLNSPQIRENVLKKFPIEDVWGIGSKLSKRLNGIGVYSASDFVQKDPYHIRKIMGVVGERILLELQGIACLNLEIPSPKKSISYTRSFGKKITDYSELAEALATFTNKASIKLRKQNGYTSAIQVFVETLTYERERTYRQQYGMIKPFSKATNDTVLLIKAAKDCLERLFKPNEKYNRGGVIFLDLASEETFVPDLFLGDIDSKRNLAMRTVDALNARFGKNTVFFGAMGVNQTWKSRSEMKSSHNTTSWNHLPVVYAK
ncbi:MAG: hypothetical protein CK425_11265 [Parachlamydia sp.]|nr:MAG: hypothetical protein CK425_11265 [Parachlamydia sp.]